jgi:Tfp pilus assembly protein FimT
MVSTQTKRALPNAHAAFSIIELMVSVSILTFITILVLANHSRFNSSLLLGNLAYDVALSVREAQIYGLSVRAFNSSFNVGYGVHFSSPTSYIFFADVNNDRKYTQENDSIVREMRFTKEYVIARYCATVANGTETCSDSGSPITYLDIVFVRPEPDALISTSSTGTVYSNASITVSSPTGIERVVDVASTGQISVQSL